MVVKDNVAIVRIVAAVVVVMVLITVVVTAVVFLSLLLTSRFPLRHYIKIFLNAPLQRYYVGLPRISVKNSGQGGTYGFVPVISPHPLF